MYKDCPHFLFDKPKGWIRINDINVYCFIIIDTLTKISSTYPLIHNLRISCIASINDYHWSMVVMGQSRKSHSTLFLGFHFSSSIHRALTHQNWSNRSRDTISFRIDEKILLLFWDVQTKVSLDHKKSYESK